MGTSIHKKASSSPVKFLGGVGDSLRAGYEDLMYGHLPPPPEHVNPSMTQGGMAIGDTWAAPGTNPYNDPRNNPANAPREQLRQAWQSRGRLFDM